MNPFTLTTPVAMLVFNRPEETSRVFAAIREARPLRLLVVADGPRPERPDDFQKCAEVRRIVEQVDWPCEVQRNYSDTNLGCRLRVSSGLDWVFDQVEEAIVLEDDCLPDPTYFRFCQEMLNNYRHDERVMMICGSNLLGEWKSNSQSYHFSNYGGIWGWGTWRRAWKYYDVNMPLWANPEIRERIRTVLASEKQYKLRAKLFYKTYLNKIDTWDYQWSFARLAHSGLSIVPSLNLISNIGFGEGATHTRNNKTELSAMKTVPYRFPIKPAEITAVDREYDAAFIRMVMSQQTLFMKLQDVCKIILNKFNLLPPQR